MLTHYCPVLPCHTPIKHQNTIDFLMFSNGIKKATLGSNRLKKTMFRNTDYIKKVLIQPLLVY